MSANSVGDELHWEFVRVILIESGRGALSNGRNLKDLSLDSSSPVAMSTQVSISVESSIPNGVKPSRIEGEITQITLTPVPSGDNYT